MNQKKAKLIRKALREAGVTGQTQYKYIKRKYITEWSKETTSTDITVNCFRAEYLKWKKVITAIERVKPIDSRTILGLINTTYTSHETI